MSIGKVLNALLDRFGPREESPREPLRLALPLSRAGRISEEDGPRFKVFASDRTDDALIRPQVREAFMPSQPVPSRPMLAGRRDQLKQLISAVEDHRVHVVLYGERGIGKTSLLGVMSELARDADYLVIRENCGADTKFNDLFRSISVQIPLIYHGALQPSEAQSRASGTLADLLPPTAVGPNQVSRAWSSIVGTRVLVVLDEFDRTDDPDFHRDVVELIKNLSDSASRVQIVIAGVSQTLKSLLGYSPSIRRNVIGVPILPMDNAEISELLEIGERYAEISFDPAAKKRIVGLVQGRPYLARLLAHHASLQAAGAKRTNVSLEDVECGLALALTDMEARFSETTVELARSCLKDKPDLVMKLVDASLLHGGSFEVQEVVAQGAPATAIRAFIDNAASSESLVAPSHEGSGRYSFVEDGLPAYLMLAVGQTGFAA